MNNSVQPGPAGVVVSLGLDESWHAIAERYARQTGRSAVRIETPSDIPVNAEVIVLRDEAITASLLEELYGARRPIAPGLLFGTDLQDLDREASFRSARVRPGAPLRLFGTVGVDASGAECLLMDASGRTSEAGTSGEPLRQLLGADSALLSVITHSDGIDASLGFNLACPMVGLSAPFQAAAPHCASLGHCPRRGFKPPNAASELIGADAFKCGVLAWIACFGLTTRDCPVARRWTFVEQARQRQACDVIVTPWNGQFFGHVVRDVLAGALGAGKNVGEAVAEVNALPGIKETGSMLALIGDPRFRCAGERAQPSRSWFEEDGSASDNSPPASSVAEALVFAAARQQFRAPVGKYLEERALAFATAGDAERITTVLEAVRWMPRSMHSWLRFSDECRALANTCPHCGSPQRLVRYHVLGQERMIATCPNCQVYLDVDLAREFAVIKKDKFLQLTTGGARVWVVEWAHTQTIAKVYELEGDGAHPLGSSAIGFGVRNITVVGAWSDTFSVFNYISQ